jgi:hypothetical protein
MAHLQLAEMRPTYIAAVQITPAEQRIVALKMRGADLH